MKTAQETAREMAEIRWMDRSVNAQKCGQALVKTTLAGQIIPDAVYQKMAAVFSLDEIRAIEAYLALHVALGTRTRGVEGCDSMTVAQMEERMDEMK